MPVMDERAKREICARIKTAREQSGKRQSDMAALLHVELRTWQNYESHRVPWQNLSEIAKATNTTWEWLVHGDEKGLAADLREMRAELAEVSEKLDELLSAQSAEAVSRATTGAGQASSGTESGSSEAPDTTETQAEAD